MHADEPPPKPAGGDVSEYSTLGDGDWPVDDHYFVQPDEHTVQAELERVRDGEAGEVAPVPAGGARSRASALGAAALVLALLLAAALGAWLVFRPAHSGTSASASASPPPGGPTGPVASSSSSTTSTTTMPKTTPATPTKLRSVPDATGLALADARARLSGAGLRVRVRGESSTAPSGRVLREAPAPGSKVRPRAFVVLTVSSGPARVPLPELVGLRADTAAKKTRALGLVPELRTVRSTRPAGAVLRQDPPAGTRVARGSSVRLEVAKNVAEPARIVTRVRVPDVGGLSASAARSRIAAAALETRVVHVVSNRPQGTVVDQSPAAGTQVRKGATVRLAVSSGPAQIAVPSVVGLDRQSAQDQLEAAGFQVQVVTETTTDPSEGGTVTAQDPPGGTKADDGSTVTVTVAVLGQP